ncbi:MAG: hypothetical protein ABW046_22665 [Actinoplanes sp.]
MTQNIDTGTQPEPHYCSRTPRSDGTAAGCPSWPGCLFPGWHDDNPKPEPQPTGIVSKPIVNPSPTWDDMHRWIDSVAPAPKPESPPHLPTRALASVLVWSAGVVLVFAVLWALVA